MSNAANHLSHAGKLQLTAITILASTILGTQLSEKRFILPSGISDQSKPTSTTHYQSEGGLKSTQDKTIKKKGNLVRGNIPEACQQDQGTHTTQN